MTRRRTLDAASTRMVFGVCGSCGVYPAPDGELCPACAAAPSTVGQPEHIGSILPRVMADILARAQHPTTEAPR